MNIPFLDLKKQYQQIKTEVKASLDEVMQQTAFSGGAFVQQFEDNFARYCNANFAIGVNNGTNALHLAMLALGIGKGDEVIIPANTFIATAWGVSYTGATPVFVDCFQDTWNMDCEAIESKITNHTKAIIGVHLYGQPFDVDKAKQIADKHKLYLIEDAAQAHGACYRGNKVGSLTDIACFSFYPGKNLGAYGEGGGITTNNESYKKHLHSLRNHGCQVRYYHNEIGYNARMGGFQGAILDIKLKYLDAWNTRRKEIAYRYQAEIVNKFIQFQHQPSWSDSVYHLFVAMVDDRSDFIHYMKNQGISLGQHYPVPCHLQKVYMHLGYSKGSFPNSENLANHCVSFPMYAELTNNEVDYIIDKVNAYKK